MLVFHLIMTTIFFLKFVSIFVLCNRFSPLFSVLCVLLCFLWGTGVGLKHAKWDWLRWKCWEIRRGRKKLVFDYMRGDHLLPQLRHGFHGILLLLLIHTFTLCVWQKRKAGGTASRRILGFGITTTTFTLLSLYLQGRIGRRHAFSLIFAQGDHHMNMVQNYRTVD